MSAVEEEENKEVQQQETSSAVVAEGDVSSAGWPASPERSDDPVSVLEWVEQGRRRQEAELLTRIAKLEGQVSVIRKAGQLEMEQLILSTKPGQSFLTKEYERAEASREKQCKHIMAVAASNQAELTALRKAWAQERRERLVDAGELPTGMSVVASVSQAVTPFSRSSAVIGASGGVGGTPATPNAGGGATERVTHPIDPGPSNGGAGGTRQCVTTPHSTGVVHSHMPTQQSAGYSVFALKDIHRIIDRYPQFTYTTRVDTFFELTLSLHHAFRVHPDLWTQMLVLQSHKCAEIQSWISSEVVGAGLSWSGIKQRFVDRYGLPDQAAMSFDNLTACRQGGGGVAAYRDKFVQTARLAGCNVDDAFVLAVFRRNLQPDVCDGVAHTLRAMGNRTVDFNTVAAIAVRVDADIRSTKKQKGRGSGRSGGTPPRSSAPCRRWLRGECKYEDCKFEHVDRAATHRDSRPCHSWRDTGSCKFGDKCKYVHGEVDKKQ